MNAKEMTAAVEAMLFASGEPLEISRIAEVLECDVEQTESLLLNLSNRLDENESGLCLLKLGDQYQMCSRSQFAPLIRDILDLKRNTPLSQAAFEVLAVIAYNQPVTKSFVEQVRGVDCTGVISTLCQRGLIEEKGRLELPGRPLIYGTTPHFLRCFCVTELDELPPLPEKSDDKLKETIAANEQNRLERKNANQIETVVLPDDEDRISEAEDTAFQEAFS